METRRTSQLRTAMELPLRDILRGLHVASDLSGDMLRRAAPMLPPPLATALRRSLDAPSRSSHAAATPDAPTMTRAVAALHGTDGGSMTALVHALGYGVQRVLDEGGSEHLIFSETVARLALSGRHAGLDTAETAAERAAATVLTLMRAHAVGMAPGLPLPPSREIEAVQRLALVTAVLWLLVERPASAAEEPRILDLCAVLTRSMADEIGADSGDAETLAHRLADLAEIV